MRLIAGGLVTAAMLFNHDAAVAAEELICPSSDVGREAFASGDAKSWPNYSEGTAARVQRQHPDTGLWAQAKFIDFGADKVAFCQYYSHVGLLMTMVHVGYERADVAEGSYWREEFVEESGDLDRPGQELLRVCMQKDGAAAYPSIGCRFKRIDAD